MWRRVREAFEDIVWRPVFFITVVPPLLIYCRLDEAKALYRAKKNLHRIKQMFRRGKGLEVYLKEVWRREIAKPRWDFGRYTTTMDDKIRVPNTRESFEHLVPKQTAIEVGTTLHAAWEDKMDEPETPVENVPETLYEAVNLLDDLIDDEEDRKLFQETSVEEVETTYHHTLGRYLRNEWRLWTEGTPMRDWFISMGLEHADDMSSIIISAWWHQLNDIEFDFIGRVELAAAYWRAVKPALEAKPGEVFEFKPPYPLKHVNLDLRGVHLDGGKNDDGKN